MKYRFITSLLILSWMPNIAQSAGLWLSNAPLFVTDVLPPNVILTPTYLNDFNEIALKNPPVDTYKACLQGNAALCPNQVNPQGDANAANPSAYYVMTTSGAAAQNAGIIPDYRSWAKSLVFNRLRRSPVARVTPWPDTYECRLPNIATGIKFACSDTRIYPSDLSLTYNLDESDSTYHNFSPLNFTIRTLPNGNKIKMQHVSGVIGTALELGLITEEPYYQSPVLSSAGVPEGADPARAYMIYDGARSKYYRSQDNFLYFDPSVTYRPWPSLGVNPSLYSPINYTKIASDDSFNPAVDVDPTYAYYNPLNKFRTDGVTPLRAQLSQPAENAVAWVWDGSQVMGDLNKNQADPLKYYIGTYYVRTQNAPVWQSNSYTEHRWDQWTNDLPRKTNFANWFTYYRSSYLATRGMVAELIQSLRNRDMLHMFRLGIHYGSYAYDETTNSIDPYSSASHIYFDAPSYNTQELRDLAIRATKNNDFMVRFGNRLYGRDTHFTNNGSSDTVLDYYKTNAPYRDNPGVADSPIRSCRRNYEIIITPDYTTLRQDLQKWPSPVISDADGDSSLGAPYADNFHNTWGDYGAKGWKTDLMPNLENSLSRTKANTAKHQHVVRYIIGPKVDGRRFPASTLTYAAAKSIVDSANFPGWPDLNSYENNLPVADVPDSIDDLWHMAINSRGMFYPSENVSQAITNLLIAFNEILLNNVSGAAVATNTTSLQSGGVVYQATVDNDWRGHLKAYQVNQVSSNGTVSLKVDYGTTLWDLAQSVSTVASNDRVIFTYNRGSGDGAPFRWNSLDDSTMTAIRSGFSGDTTAQNAQAEFLVDYIRGSGQCEDGATTSCSANSISYVFKRRNVDRSNLNAYSEGNPNGRNVLGDIANSNPLVVSAPQTGVSDVDYPGYNAHRIARENRPNILYVGANDGMLHAVLVQEIRNDNVVVASPGKEVFAYIPSFVQGNLFRLSEQTASHTYLVDGSPFAAEVNLGGNGEANDWRTVLAGGGNLGGRGYYLLDISNPINISETAENASNLVMWEFTSANDANMQYTYNMPVSFLDNHARAGQSRQIVRLKERQGDDTFLTRWAMVVGNGYQKADPDNPGQAGQQACLFIIYLNGPGEGGAWVLNTHYRRYCVGQNSYADDDGLDTNGLSTPTPLDSDGDGYVDVIYAGDLNGNVWRFNVGSDVTPANWGVAYGNANTGGTPLFVARDGDSRRQPIISPVEAARLSNSNASGNTTVNGHLLLFGTGKYFETTDRADTSVQTFYGVWDRGFSNLDRGDLQARTVSESTVSDKTVRTTADNLTDIDYCAESRQNLCNGRLLGWYWDMPTVGERLTGRISLFGGRVHFNTFYPELEPGGSGTLDPCQYGGDGWIMAFDAVGGYMVGIDYSDGSSGGIFDLTGDGVVSSGDASVAGVKVGAAIGGTTFARGIGGGMVGVYSPADLGTHASEGDRMMIATAGNTATRGRVSWYELLD